MDYYEDDVLYCARCDGEQFYSEDGFEHHTWNDGLICERCYRALEDICSMTTQAGIARDDLGIPDLVIWYSDDDPYQDREENLTDQEFQAACSG